VSVVHERRAEVARRRRKLRIVGLALVLVLIAVSAILAVVLSPTKPPRAVTIPLADRDASPALVRAAAAVDYHAPRASDSVENKPATAVSDDSFGLIPAGLVAPPFTLRTPTGKPVSLRSLRGKAVLLEFFATWCPHCAAEAPHLRRLHASLPKKDFAFVAINADSEDAASVFAHHVYFGLPFPAVLDPGDRTVTWPAHGPLGPVSRRYGVLRLPTFYVLDRGGRITWRSDGEQPDALLRRELERAAT
jgi:peroxiredoxin